MVSLVLEARETVRAKVGNTRFLLAPPATVAVVDTFLCYLSAYLCFVSTQKRFKVMKRLQRPAHFHPYSLWTPSSSPASPISQPAAGPEGWTEGICIWSFWWRRAQRDKT